VTVPPTSPAGFEPALTFEVPDGWSSVHRYADSFDVGVPDPASDAWPTPSSTACGWRTGLSR
jgi:hypothetical protein